MVTRSGETVTWYLNGVQDVAEDVVDDAGGVVVAVVDW